MSILILVHFKPIYKDFAERYDLTAQHYMEFIMCYWHWKLNTGKFVSSIEKITSLQGYKCIEKYHVAIRRSAYT